MNTLADNYTTLLIKFFDGMILELDDKNIRYIKRIKL